MTAPSPMSYSIPGVWPGARSTTRRGSKPSALALAPIVDAECRPVASAGGWAGPPATGGGRARLAVDGGQLRPAAQVLQRASRHPQQEQVEHDQEGELQPDGDRFE